MNNTLDTRALSDWLTHKPIGGVLAVGLVTFFYVEYVVSIHNVRLL